MQRIHRIRLALPAVSLALVLPSALPASATQQARPAAPAITRVIRGGTLFDSENGTTRPLGQLLIAGERIAGFAPLDAPLPDGAELIDADGCTVLPAFFDLHTHLMVAGGGMTDRMAPDAELNLATHAAFGVLHAADLHNEPGYVFALRDRVAADPSLARVAAAGAAFTVPGGHCTQFGFEANVIKAPADVDARFEALLPSRPDVIKAVVEHGGWSTLPPMPTLDEATLTLIAARAHRANVPLFCHIWTLDEAKQAVRAGADALVHGVFVGEVDAELIDLMKARGTAYVPTLSVVVGARRVGAGRSPYTRERLADLLAPWLIERLNDPAAQSWVSNWREADDSLFLRNLAKLHAAGIRCATGTDAGNPLTPHGPGLLQEIALFAEAGLKPAQALQSATIEAARVLRCNRDFGSLAPGKVADVVVVRGDPTSDLDALWRIEGVLKAGHPVDRAAVRERQLAPTRGPRVRRLGTDVEPTLDDFDDGDLRSRWGGEFVASDDSMIPGGKSKATVEPSESGGSGVLLVKAELAQGSPYGSFAGATLQFDPANPEHIDLGDARAVVLRVRGTPRSWTLALDRAAIVDYDVYAASFSVTEEWSEVRLPLDSFKQTGFGAKVARAWKDLIGVTLTARVAPGGKAGFGPCELEVDEIRFE